MVAFLPFSSRKIKTIHKQYNVTENQIIKNKTTKKQTEKYVVKAIYFVNLFSIPALLPLESELLKHPTVFISVVPKFRNSFGYN